MEPLTLFAPVIIAWMAPKAVTLVPERVMHWDEHPFNFPAIASLREITVRSRAIFFVGENGSGKSTLLEAIAVHYGGSAGRAAIATFERKRQIGFALWTLWSMHFASRLRKSRSHK